MTDARNRIATLAASGPHYVCFSQHVRDAHAKHYFGIPDSQVRLIRHAPIECGAPEQEQSSQHALRSYLERRFTTANAGTGIERQHVYPYLNSLDLPNIPYLFVSTQIRPYKNMLRLVAAVERLIRDHHINIKLITTGTMAFADKSAEVAQMVLKQALWFDVISIPRVPSDIHRLLYRFAALTIHPSFFEGGFPFVFSESVGVGTPCLLARNAAVSEIFPDKDTSAITFDPYLSPDGLAMTIKDALANRAEILRQERAILDRMAARSWSDVAFEYMEVFRAAAGETEHHGSSNRIRPKMLDRSYEHEPASAPHG